VALETGTQMSPHKKREYRPGSRH